jgi:hypothetical protein
VKEQNDVTNIKNNCSYLSPNHVPVHCCIMQGKQLMIMNHDAQHHGYQTKSSSKDIKLSQSGRECIELNTLLASGIDSQK